MQEGELPREEVAVEKAEGKMKEAYGAFMLVMARYRKIEPT